MAESTERYEVLMLAVPEITKDESSAIEAYLSQLVKEHDGEVRSFDRWGKYLLAYPVRSYDYGIYFLMRFTVAGTKAKTVIDAMQHAFKVRYNDLVMRELFQHLSPDAPNEYQRPESLEEAPEREVGSFLKQKKTADYTKGGAERAGSAKPASTEKSEEKSVEEEG